MNHAPAKAGTSALPLLRCFHAVLGGEAPAEPIEHLDLAPDHVLGAGGQVAGRQALGVRDDEAEGRHDGAYRTPRHVGRDEQGAQECCDLPQQPTLRLA